MRNHSLTVILKITERCNINCSYCYYFNGNDQTFKSRPAALTRAVLADTINFLVQGIKELNITKLTLVLHGGEPLLMAKENLIHLCESLENNLKPLVKSFSIGMQTNGTLINDNWIDIFEKYKLGLGISIDGPKELHDIYRLDHKGNGTYDKVKKSIELLKKRNLSFNVLSVVNPNNDPNLIYDHITKELGVKKFDFILPYISHDMKIDYSPVKLGNYITHIFKRWVEEDNPNISMRLLKSYLNMFLGKKALIYGHYGSFSEEALHLITIRSDGDLSTTDELMSTDPETVSLTGKNILNTTLKEFYSLPIFKELHMAFHSTPQICKSCCWENICGGGEIVNRFSKDNRFSNASVFCDGLKILYTEIYQYLIKVGISKEEIEQRLIA